MKNIALLILISISAQLSATAQFDFPNPSPMQYIKQNFGLSSIELEYSRPGLKGRVMIGSIEPYDSVWRAGANAPTKIKFNSQVEIGNNKIDTGEYVIYLIPKKSGKWIFVLNKGLNNWGSDGYNEKMDVCRVVMQLEKSISKRETLAFEFEKITTESMELLISWDSWMLRIPITAPIKEKLRTTLEASIKNGKPEYWDAAQFYYEVDKNPVKALQSIDGAIIGMEQKGIKPYWYFYYKAKILRDLGRKPEAIEAATISIKYAREHGNRNNYIKLNEELINNLKTK